MTQVEGETHEKASEKRAPSSQPTHSTALRADLARVSLSGLVAAVWLAGGAQVLAQGHGNGLAKSTYAVSSDNLARESLHWLIKVFT